MGRFITGAPFNNFQKWALGLFKFACGLTALRASTAQHENISLLTQRKEQDGFYWFYLFL